MAAKYRKIDPRLWTDEGFKQLDTRQKLVAIYVITGQSNRCGLFVLSSGKAIEEIGIDADSYAIAFPKVLKTLGWKYDAPQRVIYLPSWWKYNQPENPKHLKGCLDDLNDVPQTPLFTEFASNLTHLPKHSKTAFRQGVKAIAIAMGIHGRYQEQEQEQEQDSPRVLGENPPARKKSSAPHRQVVDFFCERWKLQYGAKYAFAGARDGKHVKWILEHSPDLDAAKRVIRNYFDDRDEYVVSRSHPLGLLISRFNQYQASASPSLETPIRPSNGEVDAALGAK